VTECCSYKIIERISKKFGRLSMYVCTIICMYECTSMHARMYVCMYICMYVCMCARIIECVFNYIYSS
jgi:hypothetical protein